MPAGRPTDCTPFFKDIARYYIENYKEFGDLIPSIAGLAVASNVSRKQLHEWRQKDYDREFSDIYDNLMAKQEQVLLAGGLSKKFSGTITALVLSKHDYSTKTDHTSSDGSMSAPVTEIRRKVVRPDDK